MCCILTLESHYKTGGVVLSGIHHVKLPVSDVARSRDWYVRVLGFETAMEFVEEGRVEGVALRRDGCQPHIALRHDPDRARALSGFDAIALLVPSRDDVSRWSARLDELGEPHGGLVRGHAGGAVLVGLHDPDGIEIRLYAD
jgi:catechol 2,3-dioxygenase-like lactoylglutathione lyase family enzyme